MPYANYHSFRIKDPKLFDKDSFRTKKIGKGIMLILGRLKRGSGGLQVQAYRFHKDYFSFEQAKQWMKKHKKKAIEKSKAVNENICSNFKKLINEILK